MSKPDEPCRAASAAAGQVIARFREEHPSTLVGPLTRQALADEIAQALEAYAEERVAAGRARAAGVAWDAIGRLADESGLQWRETDDAETPQDVQEYVNAAILQARAGWVSVTERLPDESGHYLICGYDRWWGWRRVGYFDATRPPVSARRWQEERVIYWHPTPELPEPPSEEKP